MPSDEPSSSHDKICFQGLSEALASSSALTPRALASTRALSRSETMS